MMEQEKKTFKVRVRKPRTRKPESELKRVVGVRMTDSDKEFCRRMGGGDISSYIVDLVTAHRRFLGDLPVPEDEEIEEEEVEE